MAKLVAVIAEGLSTWIKERYPQASIGRISVFEHTAEFKFSRGNYLMYTLWFGPDISGLRGMLWDDNGTGYLAQVYLDKPGSIEQLEEAIAKVL